jgi:hypothetical protein
LGLFYLETVYNEVEVRLLGIVVGSGGAAYNTVSRVIFDQ